MKKNNKKIIYVSMVLVLSLAIACNINRSQKEYTIREFENTISDETSEYIKGTRPSNFLILESNWKIRINNENYFLILFRWGSCDLDTFGYIRLDRNSNKLFYLHPYYDKLQDKSHPASKEQIMLNYLVTDTINTFYGNGWLFGGNHTIRLKTIYNDNNTKDTIYSFEIIDSLSTVPSIHGYGIKKFDFSKEFNFIEFTLSQYGDSYTFKKTCLTISGAIL